MKTIQVTDEQYEFLKQLSKQMKEQDNRSQLFSNSEMQILQEIILEINTPKLTLQYETDEETGDVRIKQVVK
jgi:hypothetical protein